MNVEEKELLNNKELGMMIGKKTEKLYSEIKQAYAKIEQNKIKMKDISQLSKENDKILINSMSDKEKLVYLQSKKDTMDAMNGKGMFGKFASMESSNKFKQIKSNEQEMKMKKEITD